MQFKRWLFLAGLTLFLCGGNRLLADKFREVVAPILKQRCVMCHGPDAQNANIRLDNLSTDFVKNRRAAETWHDVLNALNRGEMPPPGAPPLPAAERATLIDWLTAEIRRAAEIRRSTGGLVVMRRLNRVEYQNTMRDLLGLDVDYVKNLPPDEVSRDGFKNNGSALRMSALQLEYYLQAARSGLRRAIVEGPAPPVFEHHAEETVIDKLKDVNWSNRLGRTGIFVARVPEFPDEGEFVLRVKARAELHEDAPYPRMDISLGYRADTQTPSRRVALVDVNHESSQEFEFRGRIEEFPLQSRTQSKYPGLLIWIRNAYSDGRPAPEGRKIQVEVDGEIKEKIVWDEDPDFPKIVIESVDFKAPVYENWPPEHHTRLVPVSPESGEEEDTVTESVLRSFMRRAFRRPVNDDDVSTMLRFFNKVRPTVDSFEKALRETLAMVLISPDFLYRIEASKDGARRLDNYQLASRLSYFLWSTMPDERLMELADRGALSDPKTLTAEVERMLDDTRSWAFVEQFSNQWLDLGGIDRVAVNPNYYPDFDLALKAEMRRETQHFFAEVLHEDLSALNFLRSDFAMLNQPLARHYGIEGPRGGGFERVSLEGTDLLGGLLTQASILLSNSTGEDSHPIERGVWIRKVLLNDPPAPPPPAVPNLNRRESDMSLLPLKRQLELHRDNEACAHCHQGIDPWGIALEQFNAVGLRRSSILRVSGEREQRHPVDAAAILPDGYAVNGVEDLVTYLLERRDREFARALTSKLFTYALGRSLEPSDQKRVEELTSRFEESGYRLRKLVTMIVTSEPFHSR